MPKTGMPVPQFKTPGSEDIKDPMGGKPTGMPTPSFIKEPMGAGTGNPADIGTPQLVGPTDIGDPMGSKPSDMPIPQI